MVSNHLSDMLSKLSLDSENEDRLTFYLSILRRKGKSSYFISKSAGFIFDIQSKKWIYLELKKIETNFYWGCNSCQNLKTFRIMTSFDNLEQEYCLHAQAATMLWNTAEMNKKYVEDPGNVEVVSEDLYAVVHAGYISKLSWVTQSLEAIYLFIMKKVINKPKQAGAELYQAQIQVG